MAQTPTTTPNLQRAWHAINRPGLAAHTAGVTDRAAGRAPLVPDRFTTGDQRLAWNDGYHGRSFESLTDPRALLAYLEQEGQS
jgi:hypothetical protein